MKLLLLRNDYSDFSENFFVEKAVMAGVKLTTALWSDLVIDTKNKRSILKVKDHPLTYFNAVYIRTIKENFYSLTQISTACKLANIPIIDRSLSIPGRLADNKMRQLILVQRSGMNIPRSIMVSKIFIPEKLGQLNIFPIFIKATDFNKGKGVFLIKDHRHAKLLINRRISGKITRNFIIQEKIDYIRDYRVIVLGKKILGAIIRKPHGSEIRANIARGGTSVKVGNIPKELKELALKAAKTLDVEIAGVDFLEDKNGKFYFLEVNRAFGVEGFEKATGLDVTYEIFRYIKGAYS
ncbi:hypothetical protein JXA63_00335 [Candidatus Woesebacteria bacterium]|nr:hypothetical protein [Candidatus Woesebacteria bacterium]